MILTKKLTYIALGVIIVVNIYFIVIGNNKKVENNTTINKDGSNINNSIKIRDTYLYNENWNDTIQLSDLVKNKKYLILRIPLGICKDCIYSELYNLKLLSDQNCLHNICAIINVNTPRDLKELSIAFDYKFLKLGTMRKDALHIPEERYNTPFYFILDSNLMASKFFIPDSENKSATQIYLRQLQMQDLY